MRFSLSNSSNCCILWSRFWSLSLLASRSLSPGVLPVINHLANAIMTSVASVAAVAVPSEAPKVSAAIETGLPSGQPATAPEIPHHQAADNTNHLADSSADA